MLPEAVSEFGYAAFGVCENLETIKFPESLKEFGDNCFQSCSNLNNIAIPEGVETIPTGAFRKCAALTDITFPESITDIYNWAFYETPLREHMLQRTEGSVYVNNILLFGANESNVEVEYGTTIVAARAFEDCENVRTVDLASSVEIIRPGAFKDCKSLESITIPESLSSFNKNVFEGSGLKRIIIPSASIANVSLPSDVEIVPY